LLGEHKVKDERLQVMGMDYIEIRGYKSIKRAKVGLRPINILIGSNGAGKSNFITFFEFINNIYEQNTQQYVALRGGHDKILHNGSKYTNELFFEISLDNQKNDYSATLTAGDEQRLIFTGERFTWDRHCSTDLGSYGPESQLKRIRKVGVEYVQNYLTSYKKYHFHDTSKNSPFTQMSSILNDVYYLYEEGRNLAAYLYSIKEKHKIVYSRIVSTIQSIAPFFLDFFFYPNEENYVRLTWKSKYSDSVYSATDLSDGTIRFIALTVLFLQPVLPSSIIIDEPELGLHPVAIAKLAGMIQSVAAKNVQVIVATQSADLINHFNADDIITVDNLNGASNFNRLKEDDLKIWLEDYSIGDLWQRSIITGGQPNQ